MWSSDLKPTSLDGPLDPNHDFHDTVDTDESSPLTLANNDSVSRQEEAPAQTSGMGESFRSARERGERIRGLSPLGIGAQFPAPATNNGRVMSATWRRQDMALASAPTTTFALPTPSSSPYSLPTITTPYALNAQVDFTTPYSFATPTNPGGGLPAPQTQTGNFGTTRTSRTSASGTIPGSVSPSEYQLNNAYGYAYLREDGLYTRLIPADMLPTSMNIEPRRSAVGLIIVPPPRAASPGNVEQTEQQVITSHQAIRPLRAPRQCRPSVIDGGHPSNNGDALQYAIDNIIASSPAAFPPRKKEKIYCDKWVHEGICAFTQQGCRYKHEMPMDKATQMELGLNTGLPAWWRRQQAVQLQPGSIGSPVQPRGGGVSGGRPRLASGGSWRRSGSPNSTNSGDTSSNGGRFSGPFTGQSYGPIAPPGRRRATSTLSQGHNQFHPLDNYDEMDDEESGVKL